MKIVSIIVALFWALYSTSCATRNATKPQASGIVSDTAEDDDQSLISKLDSHQTLPEFNAESGLNIVAEEEGDEVAEVYEEPFCKDDIYAQYLKQEFASQNRAIKQPQPKRIKGKKNQKEELGWNEINSMHYARRIMEGQRPLYRGSFPVVYHPRVELWLKKFKTDLHGAFLKWLVRAESYRDVIIPMLEEQGMPKELFYLAMIESGFNNNAYSRAKATGPWQFMSGTAKLYGLNVGYWYDERRDPIKSTLAAARLLRDLYGEFGDWYLAMAAYNAGPGKVKKAIRGTSSRDFWKISQTSYLRPETKHYVPKMLAALIIASDPEAHGFDIKSDPYHALPLASVDLEKPVDLGEVAKYLKIPVSLIKQWNPELSKNITPPTKRDQYYSLRLPEELVDQFEDIRPQLSAIEIKDIQLYQVRRGDTLAGIARKFKIKVHELRNHNPGLKDKTLKVGSTVAVPIPGVVSKKQKDGPKISLRENSTTT